VSPDTADSDYWRSYYEVTVDRPAWRTVEVVIERFAAEDGDPAPGASREAVDLGSGAGRDARRLLAAGFRVLAIDREPVAIEVLEAATPAADRARLTTAVADLATVDIPPCDLVNASVSLPFLAKADFWATWRRALASVRPGGRFAAMVFGDRDGSAGDDSMTCPSPDEIRDSLDGWEIEDWTDREEDSTTALGEPHHFHIIELVARRPR
jgi:tellurite methyltransferase